MTAEGTLLHCACCLGEAPPPGSAEFDRWTGGTLDELGAPPGALLLCPDCRDAQADAEHGGG